MLIRYVRVSTINMWMGAVTEKGGLGIYSEFPNLGAGAHYCFLVWAIFADLEAIRSFARQAIVSLSAYFSGSAINFAWHALEQKWYVFHWCSI